MRTCKGELCGEGALCEMARVKPLSAETPIDQSAGRNKSVSGGHRLIRADECCESRK
jgi:hypothetical protein